MSETTRDWAAREAMLLGYDHWRLVEDISAGRIPPPTDADENGWTVDGCRALLDRRDRVAQGLSERQRGCLLGQPYFGHPTWRTQESLWNLGLMAVKRGVGPS